MQLVQELVENSNILLTSIKLDWVTTSMDRSNHRFLFACRWECIVTSCLIPGKLSIEFTPLQPCKFYYVDHCPKFCLTLGGTAGAVSRITGTLGKGLAALTLDEDYQKKRREQLNKRPATAREGFARGGKGLVMVMRRGLFT